MNISILWNMLGSSLALFFYPEEGGNMFLRRVG
jgi:hypothetical protein